MSNISFTRIASGALYVCDLYRHHLLSELDARQIAILLFDQILELVDDEAIYNYRKDVIALEYLSVHDVFSFIHQFCTDHQIIIDEELEHY